MESIKDDKKFLQCVQKTFEAETREFGQVSDRLHNNIVKALQMMWRQLLVIWAVVILLFIAYFFLLSQTSKPVTVAREPQPVQKTIVHPEMAVSPQVTPIQPPAKANLVPGWEGIRSILDQIRESQMKKDINLFFNAYSPHFPDLDKKKINLLKTWQKYDYLEMTFNIQNIQPQHDDTMVAKVVWDIKLEEVHSKKRRSLSRNYTIRFSQDSGKWLIQELL